MVQKDIEHFINEIYFDYCLFLYKYEWESIYTDNGYTLCENNSLNFPYCCKFASNILSTYLSLVTGYDFHNYAIKMPILEHSWVECKELSLIIDITGFQYTINKSTLKKYVRTHILERN